MGTPLPWEWSWDPQVLIGLALALALYVLGVRYSLRAGLARAISPWRVVAYCLGLLAIFVALESPIDAWSEMYLTAHMIQHELLMFVAAPLIILSAPWMALWRAFPLGARREGLRWGLQHPRLRHLGHALGRIVAEPRLVWILFVGDFLGWHVPVFYNLALNDQAVHDVEHLLFLGTSLLFWGQLIDSAPLRARLDYGARALYLFFAVVAMNLVAMAFVFVEEPIYAFYAAHEPAGGPGALVDQASAGGMMNVTTACVFALAFCLLIWKWLETDEDRASNLPVPPTGRKVRPVETHVQPTFKGKPLRWTPIVLQGGGATPRTAAQADGTEQAGTNSTTLPSLPDLPDIPLAADR